MYGSFPGLQTPDIEKLRKYLRLGILSNGKGMAVFGRPQIGKTSALRAIVGDMDEIACEPSVVVQADWDHVTSPNDAKFHRALLSVIDHPHRNRKTDPFSLRDQFVKTLCLRCVKKRAKLLVMMFDEAQIIKIEEFMWLHGVYNSMVKEGFRVFTLLSGQPELVTRIAEFLPEGHGEIIGRFMRTMFEFRGLVVRA